LFWHKTSNTVCLNTNKGEQNETNIVPGANQSDGGKQMTREQMHEEFGHCDSLECQECCEHNECDHYICLDCGKELDPGVFIDKVMDYREDRE
jgi:hypothetical protein